MVVEAALIKLVSLSFHISSSHHSEPKYLGASLHSDFPDSIPTAP